MGKRILSIIERLVGALKSDEGYRISWKANIAMAFVDEMHRDAIKSPNEDNRSYLVTPDMLHKIANQAADNFINQLIK